ncbi:uncharacterized protein LOC125494642 [Beta vulgaris subsp. vulgaris]|uniref:uncharacterized protein LOC125494642 n=1 Tax=Beta vulgaris subsp. vulgaris TaxID=3555 RepID=UPI0025468056|nr:uncharacterized protein LOC125494642 [Beta vulgaris subsp. vulgaris]
MANEEVQFSQHDWDVEKLHEEDNCPYGEEFLSLARGPIQYVTSFSGYVTNGFRFQTLQRDKNLRTQNSGVVVLGDTCDGHGALDFYGVLKEVLKLEYLGGNYIVLFRCDWYDVLDYRRGKQVDKFGYISVDTQRFLKTNEPFVLASQVSQVFYATDIVNKGSWRVAMKTKPRSMYELSMQHDSDSQNKENNLDVSEDAYQELESFGLHAGASTSTYTHNEMNDEDRVDIELEIIDASTLFSLHKCTITEEAFLSSTGILGLRRDQGKKPTFFPGLLAKATSPITSGDQMISSSPHLTHQVNKLNQVPTNVSTLSKENQVSNVIVAPGSKQKQQLDVNRNEGAGEKEGNPSHSSLIDDLHEDIHVEDFLQRSINNEAISTLLEQNVTETSTQIHEEVSNPVIEKRKRKSNAKPRGGNKCKKVANLRGSEKLGVEFYNNGPVGDNHRDMTRHMGKLVRDRTICPIRVHSWDEIDDNAKEHMWQSVLNKFVGNGFELDRKTTIDHMKRLWQNWRGMLKQFAINKKGGLENALKETPRDLTPDDWKWLVKEHFSSDAFKKISSKNSCNRGNLTMPHRTGSMPFRQVIWEEMGGKEGKDPPLISEVFKRTRQGKCGTLKEDVAAKYEEIVTVETESPSLSHFEVVEKCFGEQDRGGMVCFGLGLKPKHVRGPLPTRADLTTHLHEKQRENDELRKRIDEMEKARQEESETNNKKISSLEDKLNIILAAYMQQSSGSDQANASVS